MKLPYCLAFSFFVGVQKWKYRASPALAVLEFDGAPSDQSVAASIPTELGMRWRGDN